MIPVGLLASALLVGLVVGLSRQRLSFRADIQHAIKNGEFIVHYQPIMEISTGRCIGAEALARWRRPDGTLVPPDVFLPYCEQDDLILELTASIIRRVIADLGLELANEPGIHVAINVSARDMEDIGFLDVLGQAIEQAGLEHCDRRFRNWLFEPVDARRVAARRAQDRQILRRSHRQAGSFVDCYAAHHRMAYGLNLRIVAEGVESRAQEWYLCSAGVQYGQGWLYSKALPPELFVGFNRDCSDIEPKAPLHAVILAPSALQE